MNQKPTSKFLIKALSSVLLLTAVFIGGFYVGFSNQAESAASVSDRANLSSFWKVWDILNQKFVSSTTTTVTDQEKIYGAIGGMVDSLGDPYTVFMPPSQLKSFEEDISGNFEGVGMEVDLRDNVITVVTPLKNSPALKAGIKPGDKVLKIDDKSTQGLSVSEAVRLIRGKAGTVVKLTIFRDGENEERVISITRSVINIPAVESELRKDNIFVIRISSFSALAANQFKVALRDFVNSKSDKLIIDLRNNPGGYLESAVDISSWFLPEGKVVVTEDFGGKQENESFRSRGYSLLSSNVKVAILVNAGSASASEIMAGALREHNKAILVGEKTFGKGSVQELIPITKDTSLKVTVAKWLTPLGNSISIKGITPDYTVELTDKDIKNNKDPQIEKAAELLKKK